MQIFGIDFCQKKCKMGQKCAHECARRDGIGKGGEPGYNLRKWGQVGRWAGGQVGAMRLMATMMSPKCTMKESAHRMCAHRTPRWMTSNTMNDVTGMECRANKQRNGDNSPY